MNSTQLAVDFTKALNMARGDARRGEPRWLRELITLGKQRATRFPKEARIYRDAVREAAVDAR
jgi:hypothetical protein